MNAEDIADDALYAGLVSQINEGSAFIISKKVSSYFPGGYLKIKNNVLESVVEKPGAGNEPSNLIYLVYNYFPNIAEFCQILRATKSTADDVYEKALSEYAAIHPVRIVAYNGPWCALKFPWDMLDATKFLLGRVESHKGKDVVIKKNVIIEGLVYIEDGVKIFENTKIVGPCYIGKNVIIGNNCIVRASHIGANSVIGFNSDITRSYIGDNCWFHSNYVGDSVLEGNISMGSGAVLANLRLDDGEIIPGRNKLGAMIGKGVRIGVNASIMPGVKIGSNSFVGSGVILDKDLPDGSFCVAKPGYTITKNKTIAPTSRESFKKSI
jgi:bifunctional UDP-N-acetylglucosamine pyrophosphorylase/glucosamine-1-phosphate N-acetyltransferase